MNLHKKHLYILLLSLMKVSFASGKLREEDVLYYSNSWAVKISGNKNTAKIVAEEYGFEIVEELADFPGLYHFSHPKHPKKGKYENLKLTEMLQKLPEVVWSKQVAALTTDVRSSKCPGTFSNQNENLVSLVGDDFFLDQWYMSYQTCRTPHAGTPVYDINVVPVWLKYKLFGNGVTVLIVDDGIETTHEDLRNNYDKKFGLDLVDNDDSPDPEHFSFRKFYHGTKCAGIIAMQAANGVCGTGIAPMVKLGAVRLLSYKPWNDLNAAKALSFRVEDVDIVNNSWGPQDDGKTLEYWKPVTQAAFKEGITKGRRGKGIIYLFASGNGRHKHDTCGYDQYVNSIYTIAITGVDHKGRVTKFSERCSSVIATTYAGGTEITENIVTTTGGGKRECTKNFYGTSASSPMAAGVIALVLEANPELSWRSVQHILAWTCEVQFLAKIKGWYQNAAGFFHNHNFGFGMIDALKMVEFAKTMEPLPPMHSCVVPIKLDDDATFGRTKWLKIRFKTTACKALPSEVNFIEHVQLVVSIKYPKRGAIKIDLISPSKTRTHLLESRTGDTSTTGLMDWTLDSIHMWGENPQGVWMVKIYDTTGKQNLEGEVISLQLVIHGTKDKPLHYDKPRTYEKFEVFKTAARLRSERNNEPQHS